MESWKNGKEELFEQLAEICGRIEVNIAAELGDKNFTSVACDELQFLRARSARVGELTEENIRLSDELRTYSDVALRVEELERENKRLAGELEKTMLQLRQFGSPERSIRVGSGTISTPTWTMSPSSVNPVGNEGSNTVPKETYNSLVIKFNKLYKNTTGAKEVRERLKEALAGEKDKTKKWSAYCHAQTETIAKRDDKIKRQEHEIQRLREKLNLQEGAANDTREYTKGTSEPLLSRTTVSPKLAQVQIPRSSPVKRTHPDITDHALASPRSRTLDTQSSISVTNRPLGINPMVLPKLPNEDRVAVDDTKFKPIEPHHPSSTQDDSVPHSPNQGSAEVNTTRSEEVVDHHQSDDTPVFVSCRSIKKRKALHEPTNHEGTRLMHTPKLKLEKISSSPLGLAALNYLDESIDLDDIGEKVDTPKKRQRLIERFRRVSTMNFNTEWEDSWRGESLSPSNAIDEHTLHTASGHQDRRRGAMATLQSLSTNLKIFPRTSSNIISQERRVPSDKSVEELAEDGELVATHKTTPKPQNQDLDRLGDLLAKPSPPKRVLSPARSNQPRAPQAINQYTRGKLSAMSGLAREPHHPQASNSDTTALSGPRNSRNSLKSSQPSSKLSKATLTTSVESSRPSSKNENLPTQLNPTKCTPILSTDTPRPISRQSKTPVSRSKKPSRASGRSVQVFHANGSELEWDNDRNNEPLRTRPLRTLNLEDFKVNLVFNQGYDYAFRDVVRNKAERRCLPGCTKPECCGGQFRVLAEMLEDSDIPRTPSQQEADEALLEEFLGDNSYKIRNMSKDEKQEMVMQAKTRQLANKHGRHRHAYERRKSPPGFWDADFPTTQEQIIELEKVKEYERDLVARRYMEAMRPGGAYIFRDE